MTPNLAARTQSLNLSRAASEGTLACVRLRTVLVCLVAATLAAGFGPAPSLAAAALTIERKPEFVERVSAAIDRGAHWLRGAQQPGGPFKDYGSYPSAMTALAYYTLRTCGVSREDPVSTRAFDAMRQSYEAAKRRGELRTYTVGLLAMALAEHGDPVAAPDRERDPQSRLGADDAAWMKELVRLIEDWQSERGAWSYGNLSGSNERNFYDHSNTQYALLGLKAASRAGAKVKPATWMKSLKHFLSAQEDSGPAVIRFEPGVKGRTSATSSDRARGWGYLAEDAAYGSMTAGGVGSVVICRSELIGSRDYGPALDAKSEQSVRDGIAWLGTNFSVRTNPAGPVVKGRSAGMSGPMWHFYYLYALERAGMLSGVEWIGEHDWYGEGAAYLLGEQLGSGAWSQQRSHAAGARAIGRQNPADDYDAVQSTCFALLFLKKGTLPVARGALTRDIDDTDINFDAAGALSDADFDDFIDLVLSRWRRVPGDEAKDRILARAATVGSRIVMPLIDRLASTKDPEREAAIALLRRATGLAHGYDAAAAQDVRDDAVARWQAWWLANEKTIHFDATSGRIVAK